MNDIYKPDYRLLVVFDQSKESFLALQNAIELAKTINGAIDILCISKWSKVIKTENQVALLRSLEENQQRVKLKTQKLIDSITEIENLALIYSYTHGNVIEETQKHIAITSPDIVVIGRQKKKFSSYFDTRNIDQLRKGYNGFLLLAGEKNKKAKDQSMRLGFLDEKEVSRASELIQTLIRKAMPTLNVFTISNKQKKVVETKEKMVFYEFDKNDIVDSTISNYIQKNKIDLMCVKWNDPDQSLTKKIIIKTEIPILLTN